MCWRWNRRSLPAAVGSSKSKRQGPSAIYLVNNYFTELWSVLHQESWPPLSDIFFLGSHNITWYFRFWILVGVGDWIGGELAGNFRDCRGEEKRGGQCIYSCCSSGRSAVDPFPFESPRAASAALSIATTLPWDNNINKYTRVNIRKLYQAGTPLFSLWSIAETLHRSPIGPPAFPFASFHPE